VEFGTEKVENGTEKKLENCPDSLIFDAQNA